MRAQARDRVGTGGHTDWIPIMTSMSFPVWIYTTKGERGGINKRNKLAPFSIVPFGFGRDNPRIQRKAGGTAKNPVITYA